MSREVPVRCPKGCDTRDEPRFVGISMPLKPGGKAFDRHVCDCCGHEFGVEVKDNAAAPRV